jgi:uncharacterized RDD family membrane protein YckC
MELLTQKISVRLRLRTMLLDHLILCFVAGAPFLVYEMTTPIHKLKGTTISWFVVPMFAVYFCKDCINGRSPAKRILNIAVVDYRTNVSASPFQSLVRNLFIVIWPVEVIVALFDQERRIGDRVAGTKLKYYDSSTSVRVNIAAISACVLIASVFSYFLIWIMDKI